MRALISPEPALLGFLREGPLHGYDLHKQVTAQLGPVWRLGLSQMYAILKEYEARGWIRTIVAPQDGRPARKILKLTPGGRRAFDDWMARTARGMREFRVDFFARLYFANAAGPQHLCEFLEHQRAATRRERSELALAETSSELAEAVRQFRLTQLDTILEWLDSYYTQSAGPRAGRKKPARR
jgi:DNA-binding PadR family transcriptional regulator